MNYQFTSELSPAEVCSRLSARARPAAKGWRFTADTLFYQLMDDGRFTLIRTGLAGAGGGQPSFVGRVTTEDGKTVIRGRFQPDRNQRRAFSVFFLLPLLFVLFMDPAMLLVFLPFYAIWILLAFAFFRWIPPLLWRKAGQAVISFIEQNLLSR